MAPPLRERIPLTVIGGLLGAGKTTLLNHWLRAAQGPASAQRLAVLVNDFGAIHLDAAALAAIGLAGRLPAQALLAGLQACKATRPTARQPRD